MSNSDNNQHPSQHSSQQPTETDVENEEEQEIQMDTIDNLTKNATALVPTDFFHVAINYDKNQFDRSSHFSSYAMPSYYEGTQDPVKQFYRNPKAFIRLEQPDIKYLMTQVYLFAIGHFQAQSKFQWSGVVVENQYANREIIYAQGGPKNKEEEKQYNEDVLDLTISYGRSGEKMILAVDNFFRFQYTDVKDLNMDTDWLM